MEDLSQVEIVIPEVTDDFSDTTTDVDSPETEVEDVGVVDTDPVEGTTEETTDTPGDQVKDENLGDGRQLPPSLRQALKEISKNDPQLARDLRKNWFAARQYGEVFQTPAEATQAKELLAEVNGVEYDGLTGIEAAYRLREDLGNLDRQMSSGDPAILDTIVKDNPEGLARLMPHALERLYQTNKAAYDDALMPLVSATFQSVNLTGYLDKINDLIATGKGPDASVLLEHIKNWVNGYHSKATQVQRNQVNPERQKLDEERKAIDQERQQMFFGSITAVTNPACTRDIHTHLAGLLKNSAIPVSNEAKTALINHIGEAIGKHAKEDKQYMQRQMALIETAKKTGKKDELIKFITNYQSKLAAEYTKKTWNTYYGTGTPARAAQTAARQKANQSRVEPGKGSPSSPRGGKAPTPQQVDYSRTDEDMIVKRTAYLKGKKELYTW